MTAVRTLLALVCGIAVLSFCSGCGEPYRRGSHRDDTYTPSASNEDFVLSEAGEAIYADVATGAEDEIHALYTDGPNANTVFYRYSSNRGKTWGPSINLLEGYDPAFISTIRILRDGKGLVYALWKSLPDNSEKAREPEGLARGTLNCRVLDGTLWSKPFPIGPAPPSYLYGWFACTDSRGHVHVVWNQDQAGNSESGKHLTGTLVQVDLAGMKISAPKILQRFPAQNQEARYTEVRYAGLQGYVNANGVAHWIAERQLTCAPNAGSGCQNSHDIVYGNGEKESAVSQTTGETKGRPQLLVDARGSDHILMAGERENKPCILDITPGNTQDEPTAAATIPNPQGGIRGFQVAQGTKGEMAVLVEAGDGLQGRLSFQYNLYASTFDGNSWSKTTNVTDTATRLLADQGNSANTEPVTVLSARYAAGAFNPASDTLYLLLVAEATGINVNEQNRSEVHITMSGAGSGGSVIFRTFRIK